MTWTPIAKPTSATWTDLAKPSPIVISSITTFTGGTPIGLLLALTQSTGTVSSVVTGIWTEVAKAFNTSWTDVPKPN